MILSIIIPVYNVEPYIEKCLKSCIQQKGISFDDFEIVIINDGTKDKSMDIIQSILNSNETVTNVKIITQENAGLSAARNTGIKHAKGEYLWFVDSDDWIDDNSLQCIVDELKKEEIDILQMPYKLIYENNRPQEIEKVKEINHPVSGRECMKMTRFPNLTQSRIYKRDFLKNNNLWFTPGILHEDAEFKPRAIWSANKIKTLNIPFYNYLKREKNSITANFTIKNAEGRWYGVKSMYQFSKNLPFKDRLLFNPDMSFNMYFVLTGLKKLNKSEKEYIINDLQKNKYIFKRLIYSMSPIKILAYGLLSVFPVLFFKVYCK